MAKRYSGVSRLYVYLEEMNFWRVKVQKLSPIRIGFLTRADADAIYSRLEGDLSPENLCQDGEASPSYVRQRGAFLRAVEAELKAQGFPHKTGG
jgi:hypothetical protein